jgi:hypothetical protein
MDLIKHMLHNVDLNANEYCQVYQYLMVVKSKNQEFKEDDLMKKLGEIWVKNNPDSRITKLQ